MFLLYLLLTVKKDKKKIAIILYLQC